MAIAVILAVAGFFYWKKYYTPPPQEAAETQASTTDLGSELYGQANNPIQGELPENPIEGVYKNPFE